MVDNCDEYLREITQKYDGPVLIERLHLLTKEPGEISGKASLVALKHLSRVGQYSPYIDSFVSLLANLNSDDESITKFMNPHCAISLQNSKNTRLKDLNPENLYHEVDVFKCFQVATIYKYSKQYTEAQTVLTTSSLGTQACQIAEQSAQVGLLQGNLGLVLNQDKKIEAFLQTSLSNELYLKRLTDAEIISYWRVKFLILLAEFLKGNYKHVSTSIFDLIRSPPIQTSSGTEVSASEVLNDSNFNKFIHKDQIVIISVISILLSYSANELNEVLSEPEFISLVGSQLGRFKPFFSATNSAKFQELFKLLNSLDDFMNYDPFLVKSWGQVKLSFRKMSYSLYLSLVVRVSADHLAYKLNIPKQEIVPQLQEYIKNEKLEFQYDEVNEIFERINMDKNKAFVEKLQVLAEKTDVIETQLRTKLDDLVHQMSSGRSADHTSVAVHD